MESTNCEPDAAAAPERLCLVCRERPAAIRGQCRRCRQGTSRAVEAGHTTEQALLDRGLLLPSRQGIAPGNTFEWRRKLEELQVIPRYSPHRVAEVRSR